MFWFGLYLFVCFGLVCIFLCVLVWFVFFCVFWFGLYFFVFFGLYFVCVFLCVSFPVLHIGLIFGVLGGPGYFFILEGSFSDYILLITFSVLLGFFLVNPSMG